MLCSKTRDELLTLLDALVNETITPEQHRRLESLLLAEPEARQIFRQYLDLHCQLRQLAQSWAQEKLARLTAAIESSPSSPTPMPSPESPRPGLIYGLILGLLMGCVSGMVWFWCLTARGTHPSQSEHPEAPVSSPINYSENVAHLLQDRQK